MRPKRGCLLPARWCGARRRRFPVGAKGWPLARGSANTMSSAVGCVFCQRLPESNYQQPRAVVTQVVSDDRKVITRVQVDWGSWEPKLEASSVLLEVSMVLNIHTPRSFSFISCVAYEATPSPFRRSADRRPCRRSATNTSMASGGFLMLRPSSRRPDFGGGPL